MCYAISIFWEEEHMANKLKGGIVGMHRGQFIF